MAGQQVLVPAHLALHVHVAPGGAPEPVAHVHEAGAPHAHRSHHAHHAPAGTATAEERPPADRDRDHRPHPVGDHLEALARAVAPGAAVHPPLAAIAGVAAGPGLLAADRPLGLARPLRRGDPRSPPGAAPSAPRAPPALV